MKHYGHQNHSLPNILIVDDIIANLKLLDEILKPAGFRTRLAPTGELALISAAKEKPDLILLDIMMPGMDGFEVCRKLKENPDLKDIPVIFISALGETQDIVTALSTGGVDYINKPFQAEEVKARVNTHLKLSQQSKELKELNATKDIFFSIIAHDLRGPFNGFLGLTRILAQRSKEMSINEIQQYAGFMSDTASNVYRLLENLLEWSRMQRNLTSFEPKSILLLSFIRESVLPVLESADKKGVIFSYEIPADLVIFADSDMLGSTIRNLVSNAVKFSHRDGKVTIAAKKENGKEVEISVRDSGIGMDSEMVANLFRIDVKTGRPGTDGEHSNGLGLHLCKDFIEKHNGRIWVTSTVGEGSTFYFTISEPRVNKNFPVGEQALRTDESKPPLRKLKILIAEDDKTSRFLLAMSVKKISSEVFSAENGAEAVAAFRNNPGIDLILMDIAMPLMRGHEATREIRRISRDVVIIAQTALPYDGERELALEAGCNDFISKPFDESALFSMISKYF